MASNTPVQAQDDEVLESLDQRVTTLFNAIGDRAGIRDAVQEFVAGGALEQQRAIDSLVQQIEPFENRYGRLVEAERVAARAAGKDLWLLTYLYKTEQIPVIWRFVYYRRPDRTELSDWRVVSISFDTDFKRLELTFPETSEGEDSSPEARDE